MKKIDISTKKFPNKFALVDDKNYDFLVQYPWKCTKSRECYYAQYAYCEDGATKTIGMHRMIMDRDNINPNQVDHRDVDGLNNQEHNLRFCTNAQNSMNRGRPCDNTSGFKGVTWSKNRNKWVSQIGFNKKLRYLGQFFCIVKAARAYDSEARKLFGEFARPNFPDIK